MGELAALDGRTESSTWNGDTWTNPGIFVFNRISSRERPPGNGIKVSFFHRQKKWDFKLDLFY